MVCTLNEIIRTVPHELPDALYSLGSTRYETSKVIIKQIVPGVITAFLLAFARGIGDTASVLFTAGYSDNIPTSLNQPAATLPLAVFFQLGSPVKEVQERAYVSALILTIIVLFISISARFVSKILSRYSIKEG
jgi:phosphate transport system permease protein